MTPHARTVSRLYGVASTTEQGERMDATMTETEARLRDLAFHFADIASRSPSLPHLARRAELADTAADEIAALRAALDAVEAERDALREALDELRQAAGILTRSTDYKPDSRWERLDAALVRAGRALSPDQESA